MATGTRQGITSFFGTTLGGAPAGSSPAVRPSRSTLASDSPAQSPSRERLDNMGEEGSAQRGGLDDSGSPLRRCQPGAIPSRLSERPNEQPDADQDGCPDPRDSPGDRWNPGELSQHVGIGREVGPIQNVGLDVQDGVETAGQSDPHEKQAIGLVTKSAGGQEEEGTEEDAEQDSECAPNEEEGQEDHRHPNSPRDTICPSPCFSSDLQDESTPYEASKVPCRQCDEGVATGAVTGSAQAWIQGDPLDRSARHDGRDSMADLMEKNHENLNGVDDGGVPEDPEEHEVYSEAGQKESLSLPS